MWFLGLGGEVELPTEEEDEAARAEMEAEESLMGEMNQQMVEAKLQLEAERARVQEVSERLQQAELSMAAEREQFKREMALLQEQVGELSRRNNDLTWSNQELMRMNRNNETYAELQDTKSMMQALKALAEDLYKKVALSKVMQSHERRRAGLRLGMANLRSAAAISGPPMGGKPRLENGEANGNENGKEVEKANERQEPAQPMTQAHSLFPSSPSVGQGADSLFLPPPHLQGDEGSSSSPAATPLAPSSSSAFGRVQPLLPPPPLPLAPTQEEGGSRASPESPKIGGDDHAPQEKETVAWLQAHHTSQSSATSSVTATSTSTSSASTTSTSAKGNRLERALIVLRRDLGAVLKEVQESIVWREGLPRVA